MKRVLLALERSDDGSGAVVLARSLARDRHAEILLLRVEEWPLFGSFAVPSGWRSSDLDAVRAGLEAGGGVRARILRKESATSAAVVPQARRESASLIVLSYHSERIWMRLMSGNPAERILRESTIPVLAVPDGGAPPPRRSRILFAYDDVETAVWGLRHAIEFAQGCDGNVALLRLRSPGIRLGDPKKAAEPLTSILARRDVPAEVLPDGSGTPFEEISQASREGCGLVVLMKSARQVARSFYSLARAVLHGVPQPLLVIGDGARTASSLETPAALRMRI